MSNVIQFRRKASYPTTPHDEPTLTISIYERPEHGGFGWVVTGDGEPPTREQLNDYLGDMFLSLNPEHAPRPGIFRRTGAFFRRLFTRQGDDQ